MIIAAFRAHRGSTLFLDSVSLVMIMKTNRHNIGFNNVSSNFSTIIVLIYMQLWVFQVKNKRNPKSSKATCAYVLVIVGWFILPEEADYDNNARRDSKWIISLCSSLPIFLMTAGLCNSGFDLEPFLQCDLSRLAELRHDLKDCTVSASGKTFLFMWQLTLFFSPVWETKSKIETFLWFDLFLKNRQYWYWMSQWTSTANFL